MTVYRVVQVASALALAFPLALFSWSQVVAAPANSAPAYTGPKKAIAVEPFASTEILGGTSTSEGLSAMLTQALIKDGRFVVLERVAIGDIIGEQQLGQAGITTPETAVRAGQLLGASILVRGTVTKFNPQAGSNGLQLGLPFGAAGGGNVGVNSQQAVVEISLRLIDPATSQVVAATTAAGTASSKGFNTSLYSNNGMNIGGNNFRQTPLGSAANKAIDQAVAQVAAGMAKVQWSALVVENSDGIVFVNAGMDRAMKAGTTLHVYRKVRDLTDPGTGQVLDTILDTIGEIQVQNVREKTSVAKVVSGRAPVRGDLLRLE